MWFILALFWGLIFVRYALQFRYSYIIIVIIAYVSYVTSRHIWLPLSIQSGGTAAIFIMAGYWMRRQNIFEQKARPEIFIVSLFLLWFGGYYKTGVGILKNYYPDGIYNIIAAIIISYSIIYNVKIVSEKGKLSSIGKLLGFYGKNSLIVLFFHSIELLTVPWIPIADHMEKWSNVVIVFVSICIVRIGFAGLCTLLTLKISGLRKIFGV